MDIENLVHRVEDFGKAEAVKADNGAKHLLRWFATEHLPAHLGVVVQDFADLAARLVAAYPAGAELTTAVQKLVEAKDAAVRAAVLFKEAEGK